VVQMERAKIAALATSAGLLAMLLLSLGCESGQSSETGGEMPVTEMLKGAGAGGAVDQLDFFDALEKRSSVTWDELLTGVLMASGKRTDGGYADRMQTARRAGLLETGPAPEATAAVSAGDLARVLLRAQGTRLRADLTGEEAVSLAARRKLLPAKLDPGSPAAGQTTVAALSALRDPAGPRPSSPAPSTASALTTPLAPSGGSQP
jgi:hypothetical protein